MNGNVNDISNEALLRLDEEAQENAIRNMSSERISEISDEILLQLKECGQGKAIFMMPAERVNAMDDEFILHLKGWGQDAAIDKWPNEKVNNMSNEFLVRLKGLGQRIAVEKMSYERKNRITEECCIQLDDFVCNCLLPSPDRINNIFLVQLSDYNQRMTINDMSVERLRRIDNRTLAGLTDSARRLLNERMSNLTTNPSNQIPPMENRNYIRHEGCEII